MKSIQNFNSFYGLLLLFALFGCNEKKNLTRDELLSTLVYDSIKYTKDVRTIIVLEDKGCIKCQFVLHDFIIANKDNNECLFLIQNDEKVIDLSELKNLGDNIVFEDKRYLYNYNIINESSAIILDKNNKIDTIISLNVQSELLKNLSYLNEVINKKTLSK